MSLVNKLLESSSSSHDDRYREFSSDCSRFVSHFKRSDRSNILACNKLIESVSQLYKTPRASSANSIITEARSAMLATMRFSQSGNKREANASVRSLLESLAEAQCVIWASRGIGTAGFLLEGEESGEKEHNPFLKKLTKEYDVEYDRVELAGDIINVFFDAHNSNVMDTVQIQALEQFCTSNSYILVRRGLTDDFVFGRFGESVTKWVFMKSDTHEEKSED